MEDNFWENQTNDKDRLRLGTSYPPVNVYLTLLEISKMNSGDPIVKTVILSDGKEVDIHFRIDMDRNSFAKDLRGILDETQSSD